MLFNIIPDAWAILRKNGVYRQVKVYNRGLALYASYGSGFLKLGSRKGTSHYTVYLDELQVPFEVISTPLGWLEAPKNYETKVNMKHAIKEVKELI